MKNRILLLLYVYFPYENANTNVMLPILEKLKEYYDIDILTCDIERRKLPDETIDKCRVYRFMPDNSLKRGLIYHFFPNLLFPGESLTWCRHFIKKMRDLCRGNAYNCVISQTSPYSPQLVTLRMYEKNLLRHDSTRWLAYMTDPYAEFIGVSEKNRKRLLEQEDLVYKEADHIIVTPEMYREDNKKNCLSKYLYKTSKVPLANLFPRSDSSRNSYQTYSFRNSKVNLVFCGSIQDLSVRDPRYFFRMIKALEWKKEYHFHIVLNRIDKENIELIKTIIGGCSNFTQYDRKPLDECFAMMRSSDILVNVGNNCKNQLPSKIADYISFGKPIINFCKIEEDTCDKYLELYPFKLKMMDKLEVDGSDIKMFIDFVERYKGRQLCVDDVREKYKDYTADAVADKVVSIVDALCEKEM